MSLVPGSLHNKATKSLIILTRLIGENNVYFFSIWTYKNTTNIEHNPIYEHKVPIASDYRLAESRQAFKFVWHGVLKVWTDFHLRNQILTYGNMRTLNCILSIVSAYLSENSEILDGCFRSLFKKIRKTSCRNGFSSIASIITRLLVRTQNNLILNLFRSGTKFVQKKKHLEKMLLATFYTRLVRQRFTRKSQRKKIVT